MAAIPVSVIIATLNGEANLPACLDSLADHFAEIVVVDSCSTDRTQEIARERGVRVVPFRWNGQWPKKRTWTLANVTLAHDWVLFVDVDERMTPELAGEIAALFDPAPPLNGYFIALDYVFLGRVLRHGHRVWKLMLFDRRRGTFADVGDCGTPIGEMEGHYQPRIAGPIGRLRHRLVHDDHRSASDYFERHNRYSDWEAVMAGDTRMARLETQMGWRRLVKPLFRRLGFARPPLAFLNSYVVRMGFLDGVPGFHYAVSQAVYYWQVQVKRRERALARGRAS